MSGNVTTPFIRHAALYRFTDDVMALVDGLQSWWVTYIQIVGALEFIKEGTE